MDVARWFKSAGRRLLEQFGLQGVSELWRQAGMMHGHHVSACGFRSSLAGDRAVIAAGASEAEGRLPAGS
jgi:hypothetical protein